MSPCFLRIGPRSPRRRGALIGDASCENRSIARLISLHDEEISHLDVAQGAGLLHPYHRTRVRRDGNRRSIAQLEHHSRAAHALDLSNDGTARRRLSSLRALPAPRRPGLSGDCSNCLCGVCGIARLAPVHHDDVAGL